ncbi:MAG TPA: AAA family ATPase [Gemmataceae bacterium]|nr:AAA family ATPase [Gemmataceae bacterium]
MRNGLLERYRLPEPDDDEDEEDDDDDERDGPHAKPTSWETRISWDDIAGQEEAKRQMIEAIEMPFTHKDVFDYYKMKPAKGILLYGPPGCGKTMFGKAAATSIANLHGRSPGDGSFVYVKSPEIERGIVGESEALVRRFFSNAKEHKARHGHPAVLFFDEADSILINRNGPHVRKHDSSLVASFLTEMDGLEDSGAIVILATNRPDAIDPAIVRDGRIDRKIRINRPDLKGSQLIAEMNLKDVPVKKTTRPKLAEPIATEFFSPERVLLRLHTDSGVRDLALSHIVNGAMLAGAVSQACSNAFHRDIAAKTTSGLQKEDVLSAIDSIQKQQLDLDHSEVIQEIVDSVGGKLIRHEKVRETSIVQEEQALSNEDTRDNIFDDAA